MGDQRRFRPPQLPPGQQSQEPHQRPVAQPFPSVELGRSGRPIRAQDLPSLQRAAGNRAAARLLSTAGSVDMPVQRQPPPRTLPPKTQRWNTEEPYQGRASLRRTTAIEATAWAEIGPAPPRITYRREVELKTTDGITIYLDIRGTVYLPEGSALPASPDAALQMRGRLVRSQRTVRVDGGDVIAVNEYSPHEVQALSFGTVATAVLPGFAQLPLTPPQQEAAILAYLATLPRRVKPVPADSDNDRSTAGIVADIGTDFLPFIGEVKDLYRAVTGTDPVTGEKLKWWERALAFLGALPLIGKLSKVVGKGAKLFNKLFGFLRGKRASIGAWFAERFERWQNSRKAKRLASAGADANRAAKSAHEIERLAKAERLAAKAAPTLKEVQELIPEGRVWMEWGNEIFGTGPAAALAKIGTRSAAEMERIGVNKHVAQALRNWYHSLGDLKGGATRVNRMKLLDDIIGLF